MESIYKDYVLNCIWQFDSGHSRATYLKTIPKHRFENFEYIREDSSLIVSGDGKTPQEAIENAKKEIDKYDAL